MSIQLQKLSLKAKLFRGLGDSTRLLTIPFSGLQMGHDMVYKTMKDYNWIGEPSLAMFRHRDIQKVGSFRDYTWIVDWEMWVRLLAVGDCYVVPETLCYIRRHHQQVTKQVFKNLISRSEEYYFFKDIYKGKYNIDFAGREKEVRSFVKKKAARCSKDMYLIALKLRKKEYRRSFTAMFKIAVKEKVLFQPLAYKLQAYGSYIICMLFE